MKKHRVALLVLITVLLTSCLVEAKDIQGVKVAGDLTQKVIYDQDDKLFNGLTELDLELSKDFGFDKSLYLNPVLKVRYNENDEFSDLEFNKYNDIDYDYLKEAYFDFYLENSDIRIGRQQVNWGTAYKLNPTDLVNPMDLTTLDPFESELGVAALKGEYYYDFNTIFTGVLIGEHRAARLPVELKNLTSKMITGMAYENLAANIYKQTGDMNIAESTARNIITNNFAVLSPEERDIDGLGDTEIALKAMRRNFYGYDVSLNYFHGYEDIPSVASDLDETYKTLAEVVECNSSDIAEVVFAYKKIDALGFDIIGSIQNIGAWAEINYTQNEDDEKKIDLVLGGDHTFENGLYTVAQYFHREYKDNLLNEFLKKNYKEELLQDQNFLILHGEMPFKQIHKVEGNVIYDLENSEYAFNPEVMLSIGDGLNLNIGTYLVSDGDQDSNNISLLNLAANEKTYIEFSYSF